MVMLTACRGLSSPAAGGVQLQPTQPGSLVATSSISGVDVSLLQWNNFIPPADPFFKEQAAEWGKQTGVNVTIETVNANDLLPQFIAALNAMSGPTIFETQHLQLSTGKGLAPVLCWLREAMALFRTMSILLAPTN
jgi:ABC-type glycerol-3-phosphate transport system substrate-binding protein